jgi:hypothetical protein
MLALSTAEDCYTVANGEAVNPGGWKKRLVITFIIALLRINCHCTRFVNQEGWKKMASESGRMEKY